MWEEDAEGVPDELRGMKPNEYVLLSAEEDRDAAHRWNVANTIRKERGSVKDKILKYLRVNVGRAVMNEELRYVAGDKTEWARRVRELRTEAWMAYYNKDHRSSRLGSWGVRTPG